MSLQSRRLRFHAPKRVMFPLPVSLSLCCAAPLVPSSPGIRCTMCRNSTEAVHVRHLGTCYGAKLGDKKATGLTAECAVQVIRETAI
jgi:hypothetical protein